MFELLEVRGSNAEKVFFPRLFLLQARTSLSSVIVHRKERGQNKLRNLFDSFGRPVGRGQQQALIAHD